MGKRPTRRTPPAQPEDEPFADHPLSEDMSPPVFAVVALTILVISLAVFALLGGPP